MAIIVGPACSKPPVGARPIPTHPLARGLIGAWLFNDGWGNLVSDSLGGPAHLVDADGSALVLLWKPGIHGPALYCTAWSWGEYPGAKDTWKMQQMGDLTIVAGFCATPGGGSGWERLMAKSWNTGFWTGRWNGSVNEWGGGVCGVNSMHVTLTEGQWHQLVLRRQGTNQSIWGDGGRVRDYATGCPTNLTSQSVNVRFGAETWVGEPFVGYLDYGYIYNRSISNIECAMIWGDPFCMYRATPIWQWGQFVPSGPPAPSGNRRLLRVSRFY
jgi:hypothetical protein